MPASSWRHPRYTCTLADSIFARNRHISSTDSQLPDPKQDPNFMKVKVIFWGDENKKRRNDVPSHPSGSWRDLFAANYCHPRRVNSTISTLGRICTATQRPSTKIFWNIFTQITTISVLLKWICSIKRSLKKNYFWKNLTSKIKISTGNETYPKVHM